MEHLSYHRETFLFYPVLILFKVENHSIQLLETKENGVNGHSYVLSEAEKAFRHKKQNCPIGRKQVLLKAEKWTNNEKITKLKHRHVLMQNKFQYDNNT